MSDIKDGGSAFTREDYQTDSRIGQTGMTLRDYFAAKAMQGLIASNDEGAGDRIEELPAYSYAIADAMLKAREAK